MKKIAVVSVSVFVVLAVFSAVAPVLAKPWQVTAIVRDTAGEPALEVWVLLVGPTFNTGQLV